MRAAARPPGSFCPSVSATHTGLPASKRRPDGVEVAGVAVAEGHVGQHDEVGVGHQPQVLGVGVVADRREGRLDGHRQAQLAARHLVGVERVEHAGADVEAAVDELAHEARTGAAATDQMDAATVAGLDGGRGENVR